MGKLNAIRANVGWTNFSSVSNYFSDNAGFEGLSSIREETLDSPNGEGKTLKTSVKTEDTAGTVSNYTEISTQSLTNNFGGKTTFSAKQTSNGNFKFTNQEGSGKDYTSDSFGNHTQSQSYDKSTKSDRFAQSSESIGETTFKSSSATDAAGTTLGLPTGFTIKDSGSYTKSIKRTYSSIYNSTITAGTTKSSRVGGKSETRKFLTTVDGERTTSQTNSIFPNTGEADDSPAAVTQTQPTSRIRSQRSSSGTSTTYSYKARVQDTFVSNSTITLINESLFESIFTYTQDVTTYTTFSTYSATSYQPTNLTNSFYNTADTTQSVVSTFYVDGGVAGYIPLDSLNDWVTTQFPASDLVTSISYWNEYLPNRNAHEHSIEAESTANDTVTYYYDSLVFYPDEPDSSDRTTFTYTTESLTDIITTDSTITGQFSFGKTSEIVTAYSTSEDAYFNYTNLSTDTVISYIQTIAVSDVDEVVTTTAGDICLDTTTTSTYYNYSSDVSSETKKTYAVTDSRQIAFFKADDDASYSSTYLVIERSAFPFFSVAGELGGYSNSLISRKWGGLNGFQKREVSTRSDAVTGIPTIDFTDQFITTGSRVVTDVSTINSVVNTTTSFGPITTATQDSFQTTTTFTSGVTGNKIEETEYELPLYDTSYKLNRYYTYIPTSGSFNYVAGETSFFSTNNEFSVTNTRSQIFKTNTALTDNTFSYSSLLFGIRKTKGFGDVTTREIPNLSRLKSVPGFGEIFVDTEGTLFLTGRPLDRDFDPSIFTGTEDTDYITFDLAASHVISSTMPKHKILRLKNTHGLIKGQDAFEYTGEEYGSSPIGQRYYFNGEQQFDLIYPR